MGRTQLALAYAQQYRQDYSAIFWINAKTSDTLKQGCAAAISRIHCEHPSLAQLKVVAKSGNLDKAVDAFKLWLSSAGNNWWLLICDNYDTPRLPGCVEPGPFDLRHFLPKVHHGAILITTRSSQVQLGRSVQVKKLQDVEHSLEILSQASRRNGVSVGTNISSTLVRCC
jgi:hypothetical protein